MSFIFIPAIGISADRDKEIIDVSIQADKELESTLQQVVKQVRENNKGYPMLDEWISEIYKSQDAWLKYRDYEVQVVGHRWRNGGAGRPQTEWKTKITLDRINLLRKYYDPR